MEALRSPFCFHEIRSCHAGMGLTLRNVLTQEEVFVYDVSASRSVSAGSMLFGQVVKGEGTALLGAAATLAIPPGEKPRILSLRAALREEFGRLPTSVDLASIRPVLFALYWDLYERLVRPAPPVFTNTDGDPLEKHTLHYEVDDVEAALGRLARLCGSESRAEILERATRDAEGRIEEAEIIWNRPGTGALAGGFTLLGRLVFTRGSLTVEVNSARRAARVAKRIDTLAGGTVRYVSEDVQAVAPGMMPAGPPAGAEAARQQKEFERSPEVRAVMAEFHRKHLQAWLDEKVPALGGRTPREAVRDPDGREMVEALLADFERRDREMRVPGADPAVYDELRASLGME
jgi:hypothetical protein